MDIIDRYIGTWNELDPAARQAAIDDVWTEDAYYVDPTSVAEGREAINAMIGAVQGQFTGLVFRLGGPVDAHHELARFVWELAPEGGAAVVVGFDVAVLAEDGRIRQVHGFVDTVVG
jgi:hypothetical protein